MASKRKPAKKRDPNQITAAGSPNEDKADFIAKMVLRPTVQAAVTLKEYDKSYGDLDLSGLIDALTAQTKAVTDGDLGRGEAMLTTQAHVLDAVFNNLARRANTAEYMGNFDRYLKLALRAQSQCRATWEALATMKNPPMMGYVIRWVERCAATSRPSSSRPWRRTGTGATSRRTSSPPTSATTSGTSRSWPARRA